MLRSPRLLATFTLFLLPISAHAAAAPTPAPNPAPGPAAAVVPAAAPVQAPSAPSTSAATAAASNASPSPDPAATATTAAPPLATSATAPPTSDPFPPAPTFDAPSDDSSINLRIYGDTQFQVRDHAQVHNSFAAAHIDLFPTADVGKLSFLSEVFFESGDENEFSVDIERLQISYLFSNWLRVRAGRTHTAFGYYNDAYHHGNLFELTTGRPYAVNFEDDGGLIGAHLVGVGIDGTFDTSSIGSFRYDLETGNGRLSDFTAVAVDHAEKDDKLVNLRLRWMPIDGLTLGVNGLHDVVPARPSSTAIDPGRPKLDELIGGAHAVYMEHDFHILLEAYIIEHKPSGVSAFRTRGGFAELGYAIGEVTPYTRFELIQFPRHGDPVYQDPFERPTEADPASPYLNTERLFDARVGVRWQPMPQLALKLEAGRLSMDAFHQESATVKAAFGF